VRHIIHLLIGQLPSRTACPDNHSNILLPPHIDRTNSNNIFTIQAFVHTILYVPYSYQRRRPVNLLLQPRTVCLDHLPSPIKQRYVIVAPYIDCPTIQTHLHHILYLNRNSFHITPYVTTMLPTYRLTACDQLSNNLLIDLLQSRTASTICQSNSPTLRHCCLTHYILCPTLQPRASKSHN
jgi:hypothetical protein